ncbi:adenosylcobinamide-GDP ribazoletransferase [Halobaculum sp. MBLA0147]|uniref:adenosylcobinamide-GDP ribazoletransferase n=1 Tax=Halobaculum sp. MBLA0147 TaxID=3079934 RepID=UPI0035267115
MIDAVRGAVGFLTRVPVGHSERAWRALTRSPWAFPVVGYPLGLLVAVPVAAAPALSLPPVTGATAGLALLLATTGITHLDGVADLGDAAVVHGDAADRLAVLEDTTLGVGGAVAVGVALLGLWSGFAAAARRPVVVAVTLVVAAEVGARAATATTVCLGTAAHEGLGSQFADASGPRGVVPVLAAVTPLWLLPLVATLPTAGAPDGGLSGVVGVAPAGLLALVSGVLAGAAVAVVVGLRLADRLLGGVTGDVFGAVNELARVLGLHVGVVAWTLS